MFIALAQLIIAIDVTVVNVALPSVQADLGMSHDARQWIIAAYTLAFGGLLLTGGRLADHLGHRRTFLIGLCAFALASALAGVAQSSEVLITARVLQGMSGALLSPSALALVTTTFSDRSERAKAFGVYSAVASSGLAAGLVVGGLLTEYASWRWAFYLSVPCALLAAVGGALLIPATAPAASRSRLDLPGAALSTGGLVALVIALSQVLSSGWNSVTTLLPGVAAVVLLAAFVVVEKRVSSPLLPLRLLRSRTRVGVYLAVMLAIMGLFGLFLLTTFYLQTVRGFSPLETGLAFLPLVVGMAVGATQVAGRLPDAHPQLLMSGGFALAMMAMLLMTRLRIDSGYVGLMLPTMVLLGVGLGMVFVPATNLSTSGVAPTDAGVASAVYVTVQQIGAAIGTVALNGAATRASAQYVREHAGSTTADPAAVIYGFTTSLWWTLAVLALGVVVTMTLVRDPGTPAPRSQRVREVSSQA